MKVLSGRVWKFGDNVDTHFFLPSKYDPMARARDYQNLAPHVLEGVMPDFVRDVRKGDIIVAGEAFGSGKHVHGLINALRLLGVDAIIASGFANTFEKEAINTGFPALTYPDLHQRVSGGDRLELKLDAPFAHNLTTGQRFKVRPTHSGIIEILDAGGLAALTLRRLGVALAEPAG